MGSSPRVGQCIVVGEDDYLYGAGTLRLRVSGLGEILALGSQFWQEVTGIRLRIADQTPLWAQERTVLVRCDAWRLG